MDKKLFRNNVLKIRKEQDTSSLIINSTIITKKVLNMPEVKSANNIMVYLDFNNEVMTNDLTNSLIDLGKQVFSPVTIKDDRLLIPTQIKNLNTDLIIGAYGIREPNSEKCSSINPSDLDLVIVPAVAYNEYCYRLGYGGGYYDRFIENLNPNAITIGIAFECQIFNYIPKEPHDAQLDFVVSEKRILATKKESY